MVKAKTCQHGITPKRNCKECKREYCREYSRIYRKKNRKHINDWRKDWHKRNPEKYKKYKQAWRVKHPNYRQKQKERIEEILGNKCIMCNKKEHLISHEVYGRIHTYTLQYVIKHHKDFVRLCRSCHNKLHYLTDRVDSEVSFTLLKTIINNRKTIEVSYK